MFKKKEEKKLKRKKKYFLEILKKIKMSKQFRVLFTDFDVTENYDETNTDIDLVKRYLFAYFKKEYTGEYLF